MRYDDVISKLIVLYIAKTFRISITDDQLFEFAVWGGALDYFSMRDALIKLLDDGYMKTIEVDGEKRYDITPHGEETLELLKNGIPAIIRYRIDVTVNKKLDDLENGPVIDCSIEATDRGNFMAVCGLYHRRMPVFELKFMAGSRELAATMAANFEARFDEIYNGILEKIIDELP